MGQMFEHELNPTKGWPSPYALDKTVELDTSVDAIAAVFAGMVGHMSPAATGKLRLGIPAADKAAGTAPMPLFLFQNATDYDVQVDSGTSLAVPNVFNLNGRNPADAASVAGPVSLRPRILGLVATGGYELETTEFTGTPTTQQVLTSPVHAVDSTNKGKLKAATNATTIPAGTIICGTVSDGVIANDHVGGPSRLRFWPCYDVVWTTPT